MAPTDTKTDTKTPAAANTPAAAATNGDAKKRPGRKPGTKATEYDFSALDMAALTTELPVTEKVLSATAPGGERDERQRAIDDLVAKNYREWVDAGKPSAWAKMPKVRRDIPLPAVDAFKALVRRACALHMVSVKWGAAARNGAGAQIVVFAIRDTHTRKPLLPETPEPAVISADAASGMTADQGAA